MNKLLFAKQFVFWAREYTARNIEYREISNRDKDIREQFRSKYSLTYTPTGREKELENMCSLEEIAKLETESCKSRNKFHYFPGEIALDAEIIINEFQTNGILMSDRAFIGQKIDQIGGDYSVDLTYFDVNTGACLLLVDINQPLPAMKHEIEFIYHQAKMAVKERDKNIKKRLLKPGLYPEDLVAYEEAVSFSSFKISGVPARVAGLWLWDRAQQIGGGRGTKARAIAEFRNKYRDLSALGLNNPDDADLRHYLNRTDACIKAAEVLSFSKKGTSRTK